jgi:imidazolonepropionase
VGAGTTLLLTGIAELTTNDLDRGEGHADPGDALLGIVRDAAVLVSGSGADARIEWVGPAAEAPDADERRDLGGRAVIPGFVDSHSHLVFAGDRSAEFAARMTGTPYDGGGIAVSVAATRAATTSCAPSSRAASPRCAPRARRPSRSRAATA